MEEKRPGALTAPDLFLILHYIYCAEHQPSIAMVFFVSTA